MPVFSKKKFICGTGGRGSGGGGGSAGGGGGGGGGGGACNRLRPACAHSSDNEDGVDNIDDSTEPASDRGRKRGKPWKSVSSSGNSSRIRRPSSRVPSGRHNEQQQEEDAEFEAANASTNDANDFRFFLTVSDLQQPPPASDINGKANEEDETAALEFEHAEMNDTTALSEAKPAKPAAKKRPAAKSSCGRATSDEAEDEAASTEEDTAVASAAPAVETSESAGKEAAAPCDEFLVLLTGLLAHEPPSPDDFRFLLTVVNPQA